MSLLLDKTGHVERILWAHTLRSQAFKLRVWLVFRIQKPDFFSELR